MAEALIYYKSNARFAISVRLFVGDKTGHVLTQDDPYIAVEESKDRGFLQANKYFFQKGYLIKTDEPLVDMGEQNAITEDEAIALVKKPIELKKRLPLITSDGTLFRLLEVAKDQKRSPKIVELIEDRLGEVSPALMVGVEDGTEEE